MIQQPTQSRRMLVWVLGVLMLAFCATSFAGTFTVKITPKSSGHVLWSTTDPSNSGTISGSGGSFTYTMNSSLVILTFVPNTGGSIVKVMTNEGDDTAYVLSHGNQDSWDGPGENSKKVTVTFSGGSTPTVTDPTGVFGFSFPTNNALLTAITDLSGTYTGVTMSVAHPRHYNVSVAQDESGKLSGVGTVEGIVPRSATRVDGVGADNTIDTGVIGAITTVNGQPTAQLKGKFDVNIDGTPATGSGSGQGPVAVSKVGNTNYVTGTASIKANVGGVPYSLPNTPLTLPVPATAPSHIHKSWSIALTITNIPAGAKSSIMASAILILPNGDHIAFPLKKTKYSATKGYSLSFKGGSNTTAHVMDKKTKVSIKGMTLTKPASTWTPNAGTIGYQFLGQKGTADLMDFVP